MVRWNITIPEKTDRAVHTFLARTGGKKGDLSRFVDEAVRKRVFDLTVSEIKDRVEQCVSCGEYELSDTVMEQLEMLFDSMDESSELEVRRFAA